MMKTKTWYVGVKIEWAMFGIEGETREEAIERVKEIFYQEHHMKLSDNEIIEVTEDKGE
jgi:hypothetical protein